MFAICSHYANIDGLETLPAGKYLCIDCNEETKEKKLNNLIQFANEKYNTKPDFIVQMIVISGVLKWNYQIQVLIN